jgi:hypothetical protein
VHLLIAHACLWWPWSACHDSFHICNFAWTARQDLVPVCCDEHIVFEANAAKGDEALQNFGYQERGLEGITLRGIKQRRDEVAARLYGEDHASLKRAIHTQLTDAGLLQALRAWRVAAHIVCIDAQQMAQSVRHEHSA